MADNAWIGYAVGAVSLLFAGVSWLRTTKSDSATVARWMGKIDEKMDNIEKRLSEWKGVPERIQSLESRMDNVERKMKE